MVHSFGQNPSICSLFFPITPPFNTLFSPNHYTTFNLEAVFGSINLRRSYNKAVAEGESFAARITNERGIVGSGCWVAWVFRFFYSLLLASIPLPKSTDFLPLFGIAISRVLLLSLIPLYSPTPHTSTHTLATPIEWIFQLFPWSLLLFLLFFMLPHPLSQTKERAAA